MGLRTHRILFLPLRREFVCLACLLLAAGLACAEDAQVQVGTLDGAPIYHWRAFKSEVVDDVDRALILREFERKEFNVPPKLVDERIHDQIAGEYGGDAQKFMRELQAKGFTLTKYRDFVREEIILSAMTMQHSKTAADRRKVDEQWLASLRSHAKVEKFPANSEGESSASVFW